MLGEMPYRIHRPPPSAADCYISAATENFFRFPILNWKLGGLVALVMHCAAFLRGAGGKSL